MAGVAALLAAPLLAVGARGAERARADGETPAERRAPPEVSPGWRAELARPGAWRIALAFTCVSGAHGVVSAHMLALLAAREAPPAAAVAIAAAVGPCQVAGRLLLLSAPSRWRAATLLPAAFAILTAAFATLLFGAGVGAAAAFAALLGAAYGATTILRPVVLAEVSGTERFGTLSGLVAAPFAASFALAPFLGGVLREAGGATLAIGWAGALAAAGFVIVLPLARTGR
jgi:predicted MFS family arabinose efflux permease